MAIDRRSCIAILGGLMGLWPTWTRAEDIAFVQVLDEQFRLVRKITSVEELAAFQALWSGRAKVGDEVAVLPQYKIDISNQNRRGGRWLYDPQGLVRLLSKRTTPVYRLASPGTFNTLLGISATP